MKICSITESVSINSSQYNYTFPLDRIPIELFIEYIMPYIGDTFKSTLLNILYLSSTSKSIRIYLSNNYLWKVIYLNHKLIPLQKEYHIDCLNKINSVPIEQIISSTHNISENEIQNGDRPARIARHKISNSGRQDLQVYDVDNNIFSMVNTSLYISNNTDLEYNIYWINRSFIKATYRRKERLPMKYMGKVLPKQTLKLKSSYTGHKWICIPNQIRITCTINLTPIKTFILNFTDIKWRGNTSKRPIIFKAIDPVTEDLSLIQKHEIIRTRNFKNFRYRFMHLYLKVYLKNKHLINVRRLEILKGIKEKENIEIEMLSLRLQQKKEEYNNTLQETELLQIEDNYIKGY